MQLTKLFSERATEALDKQAIKKKNLHKRGKARTINYTGTGTNFTA
jgi:hypothetical protein